jgi:hypothetical protein
MCPARIGIYPLEFEQGERRQSPRSAIRWSIRLDALIADSFVVFFVDLPAMVFTPRPRRCAVRRATG